MKSRIAAATSSGLSSWRKWTAPSISTGPRAPGISSTNPCAYCGGRTRVVRAPDDERRLLPARGARRGRGSSAPCSDGRARSGRARGRRARPPSTRASGTAASYAARDLVVEPLRRAGLDEAPDVERAAELAHDGAEAQPRVARRPAAADAGVEDDEPRRRAPGARRRSAARSGRPSRARRASGPSGRAPRRAARSSRRGGRTSTSRCPSACRSGRSRSGRARPCARAAAG